MPDASTGTLTPTRWRRIEAALDGVLGAPREEWPARIAEACGDDAVLRREVASLLDRVDFLTPLDRPAAAAMAASLLDEDSGSAQEPDPLVGAELGPWRITREIGRGGMARVYRAERMDGAFEQVVAIKVLRAELDAPADLARFRRERRLLSTLDHPHIARLLDAGVTPGGRPFLVLEYIDGDPLLAYCDAHALGITRRLQLFLGVADGVDAAHRHLILHRDIKPSNVMVGRDGRVRLLDFGVSTLLEGGDDEGATTRGQWLTPEYASPEQLQGAPLTSASDVYQLGALLYELLSGTRAFVPTAGTRATARPALRDDPVPPSRHRAALRGDLDAIVLKAMRTASDDRYPTVRELATDIRRYLAHEPVYARAGNRWYRWRRWTTRYAAALAVTAVLLLAAGGSVATLAASRRRIAKALTSVTLERTKANEITGFLLALFRANDPLQPAGDTVSARTLLQRGVSRIDSLSGQPEVQAALLQIIGQIQWDLGSVDSARRNLSRAVALRRQLQTFDDARTGELLALLGRIDLERGSFRTAEAELRTALAAFGTAGDTSQVAISAQYDLAIAYHQRGARAESRAAFDAWERRAVANSSPRSLENAERLYALGERAETVDSLRRAERLYRAALSIFEERLGTGHVRVADAEYMLADVEWRVGDAAVAEARLRHAIAVLQAAAPGGDLTRARALLAYAERLSEAGRNEEALAHANESLSLFLADAGNSAVAVATTHETLGRLTSLGGNYSRAAELFATAEGEYGRLFGEGNAMLVRARFMRGDVLWKMGRSREGEALLASTYRAWIAKRGPQHPTAAFGLRLLLANLVREGRTAEAERYRAIGGAGAVEAAHAANR